MTRSRTGLSDQSWTFEDDGLDLRQRMGRLVVATRGRGGHQIFPVPVEPRPQFWRVLLSLKPRSRT